MQALSDLLKKLIGRMKDEGSQALEPALKELLKQLSETMEPMELLSVLPTDGNILFFLPYIETSWHQASSRRLLKVILCPA